MEDDEDDELDLDPIGAAYDRHAISVHHPRRAVEVVRNAHLHQVRKSGLIKMFFNDTYYNTQEQVGFP